MVEAERSASLAMNLPSFSRIDRQRMEIENTTNSNFAFHECTTPASYLETTRWFFLIQAETRQGLFGSSPSLCLFALCLFDMDRVGSLLANSREIICSKLFQIGFAICIRYRSVGALKLREFLTGCELSTNFGSLRNFWRSRNL